MLNVDIKHKSFGSSSPVIHKLQFAITAGERVALVGPSGAGKSTLLSMIAGLDNQFSGTITRSGNTVVTKMFQDARLMPWLTVRDNILLVGDDTPGAANVADELIAAMGLADARDKFPGQIPGGMKKRVALARAFLPGPDLLLMDEPFASLDAPAAAELRQQVIQLCLSHQVTLLCVTHSLDEAVTLADRILFFSAEPMALLLDQDVSQWKNQGGEGVSAGLVSESLLGQYPEILRGVI